MAKSLKAANLKWLWSTVALDALVCVLVAAPTLLDDPKPVHVLRALLLPAGPVIVLLLTSLIPSDAKAVLVFWRWRHAYPGHRAFTEIAVTDTRYGIANLEKNVGALPTGPKEQNERWFKLYKKVEGEVTVAEPHQAFLLLRDLASMSVLLVPAACGAALVAELSGAQIAIMTGLFGAQYLATAIGAQNNGKRMVANVLALHAVKKRR